MFPENLKRGADFKQSVIESIDRIIDYLHSTRITVDNRTLSMQQNSAGITLSARPAVKMRRSETPVETSGGFVIGVVVSATPEGGPATIAEIILNADGTFQETGVQHQVIIPRL